MPKGDSLASYYSAEPDGFCGIRKEMREVAGNGQTGGNTRNAVVRRAYPRRVINPT